MTNSKLGLKLLDTIKSGSYIWPDGEYEKTNKLLVVSTPDNAGLIVSQKDDHLLMTRKQARMLNEALTKWLGK